MATVQHIQEDRLVAQRRGDKPPHTGAEDELEAGETA